MYNEEWTKDLGLKEESHEWIYNLEVVEPITSFINVNKNLTWPTSSLPTLKLFFQPQHSYVLKMSHVGSTCRNIYYYAKLDGNPIQRSMGSVVWHVLLEEATLWWSRCDTTTTQSISRCPSGLWNLLAFFYKLQNNEKFLLKFFFI